MSIINIQIIKTIDEREMQETTTTTKKQRSKGARGTEARAKEWELNGFVLHLS